MNSLQATALKAAATDPAPIYPWKTSPYSSHSALLRLFPAEGNGRTVLDTGCGNGYLAAALAARGFRVTGIDRPEQDRHDFPRSVQLIKRDLDDGLPRMFERFDYVVCADILEHLRHPAGLLRDLHDVMQPNSLLIASLPNSGHVYFRARVALGSFPKHDQGLFDRTHLHFFTRSGWRQLFEQSGFHIRTTAVTSVPFERAFASGGTSSALRAAEWVSYQFARVWKTLFAYQFVVTATSPDDAATG
jgi:SAM-dependent methyltransferase